MKTPTGPVHRRLRTHPVYPRSLGATYLGDERCRFCVWAPKAKKVEVNVVGERQRKIPMEAFERGYFQAVADSVPPGTRYFYRLNEERDLPDPASRLQPDGVHEASAVVDPCFDWQDRDWRGIPLGEFITYEIHPGTFSSAGTFAAIRTCLDELTELGVTALELMPVAQFPGNRNWGYDGVYPFAVQNSYGGPAELKRLVNECHLRGLAVVLDVVYNHLGPEGNYLEEYGEYFTTRYQTPWGKAINFDGGASDEVRRYFIENALYWIDEFHIDALRLDAVHAIYDFSAHPFLQELAENVRLEAQRLNRQVHVIAESSLNDSRLVRSADCGGLGLDAEWCDDFHHALRTTLTTERSGYYADYRGFDDLVKAFRDGYVLDGRYSTFRGRRHGNSARGIHPQQLIVCSQNHDQVGNRMMGERLTELVSFEALKLSAAVVLLAPYPPLLFMGEEYGEIARFQYFVSHLDPQLCAAVREGRRREFAQFRWQGDPPDPTAEETFTRSQLDRELRHRGRHRELWGYYQDLIRLRRFESPLTLLKRDQMETQIVEANRVFSCRYRTSVAEMYCLFHFSSEPYTVTVPLRDGVWALRLDSAAERWGGPGTTIPSQVESPGHLSLTLAPMSATVLMTAEY